MNNLWRKSFMAGILSVSLTAGAVTPVFASAAPDGKTDAASLAGGMGISRNWESWKAEWEAVKNDWTQVSLTPGSDFSQLNFAWYSKKTILTQQKRKKNRLHRSSPLSQVMLSVTAVNLSLQEQKPILQQVKQWKQHRLKRQNQMQQQK